MMKKKLNYKKLIRLALSLLFVGILLSLMSCQEDDPLLVPDFEFTESTQESFDPLTLETLESIETPFTSIFQSSTAGRIAQFELTIDSVITLIENNLPGVEVVDFEVDEERGLTVWKIDIRFESGAYVEIVVVPELAKVLEVEGQVGPFEYELIFGESFITLQEGIQAALEAVGSGEIIRWELELEEENEWELEVLIVNELGKWEVEISAKDGIVIEIKQKDAEEKDETENDRPGDQATQEILDIALAIVDGEVIHSEKEDDEDEAGWEVVIKTASGSLVKIEFTLDGVVREIEGEDRPFDYEVTPGDDLLTFTEALEIVYSLIDGKLMEWEFEREEELAIYEFELETHEGEAYIVLDAATGEVLKKELDGEEQPEPVQLPETIRTLVAEMVTGDIIRYEFDDENGIWYVKVEVGEEIYVKLELTNEGELINIEAGHGPFDYNVTPGGDLISFADAKEIALVDQTGELEAWDLEMDDMGTWIYTFYLVEGDLRTEVKVDAIEAVIIE